MKKNKKCWKFCRYGLKIIAKLKFLIFWFHNIKIWFKWNKIRPRLWCCKIKNFNFLPDFRKFYLLFETPSSSKYITGIPCNHHTSDVWYVKRLYSNFLLKTSNFRDLRRFFLNHVLYDKIWEVEFVRALFLVIFRWS